MKQVMAQRGQLSTYEQTEDKTRCGVG
jgi:hypothetical protein